MVWTCCVQKCPSRNDNTRSSISFHKLPNDVNLYEKWIDVIPGKLTKKSLICGLHFKAEDFVTNCTMIQKLKPDAIPSVFPDVTKMVGCSIRKCKSKSVKGSFVTFFSFPLDNTVANEWLKYCESNTTTADGRVCSLHFTLADYMQLNPKRIKSTAIPTLNIDDIDDNKLISPLNKNQEVEVGPVRSLIKVKKEFSEMQMTESPFFADGMGSKSAVRLRARGVAYKCDLCGRKLMTPDAVVAHQRTAHNVLTQRKPILAYRPRRRSARPQSTKLEQNSVEYKCPKCFKLFCSYPSAYRHIQKFHNLTGKASQLLQPERVEQCSKCKQKVKSIHLHLCHVDVQLLKVEHLVCGACDDRVNNIKSFVIHILSAHADSVESMFFPTSAEFLQWKSEMEAQTSTRYIIYERSDSKKFFHCDYTQEINKEASHFCPSILVVQEFSKGIQIHYYKNHHKHNSVAYSLGNQFKKYSITSFLQENNSEENIKTATEDKEDKVGKGDKVGKSDKVVKDDKVGKGDKEGEGDLYLEFKTLMKGIIVDAAKINITTLKILLGMAIEMVSIVSNYDEEKEEHDINNHHLTDDQITKALEIKLSTKRKSDNETSLTVKRSRLVIENKTDIAPKIVNTFSLTSNTKTDENVDVVIKEEVEDAEDKKEGKDAEVKKEDEEDNKEERDPYSSAFNDSYKDFVVKNFAVPIEGKQRLKRQVVKTKIGQFKPTSPESAEIPKIDKDKPKILQKPKVDKPKVVERPKPKVKAKGFVKNVSQRLNFEKLIEPEYEVKEQEGDCNILILKF